MYISLLLHRINEYIEEEDLSDATCIVRIRVHTGMADPSS